MTDSCVLSPQQQAEEMTSPSLLLLVLALCLCLPAFSSSESLFLKKFHDLADSMGWRKKSKVGVVQMSQHNECPVDFGRGLQRGMEVARDMCASALIKDSVMKWTINRSSIPWDMSCLDMCLERTMEIEGAALYMDTLPASAFIYGHPRYLTQVYRGKDYAMGYVPIPKTGSSWLRHLMFQHNSSSILKTGCFSNTEGDNLLSWHDSTEAITTNPDVIFAVIRDPFQRFISGIQEICDYETQGVLRKWGFEMVAKVLGTPPRCGFLFRDNDVDSEMWLESLVLSLGCGQWDAHITPLSSFLSGKLDLAVTHTIPFDELAMLQNFLVQSMRHSEFLRRNKCIYSKTKETRAELIHAVEARCKNRRSRHLRKSEKHTSRKRAIRAFQDKISEKARNVWCEVFAEDYLRYHHHYCPPYWCHYEQQIPACGGSLLLSHVVFDSNSRFAAWVVPKLKSEISGNSLGLMVERYPQLTVKFWRALLSHIDAAWLLKRGYHIRVLPVSSSIDSRRNLKEFMGGSNVPAMADWIFSRAMQVGFVVCVLADRTLQHEPSVLPISSNPAYNLYLPLDFVDKQNKRVKANVTSLDIMLRETPLTRVFLDAQARPVYVVTVRRMRSTEAKYPRKLNELTDDELIELLRSAIYVAGHEQWTDMRINHGAHQNIPHVHLKVRVGDETFIQKWGLNSAYLELKKAAEYRESESSHIDCKCSTDRIHLIQYGSQRTGSTLQFQILCALAVMTHGISCVHCGYEVWSSEQNVLVTKTHNATKVMQFVASHNTSLLFMTTGKEEKFPSLQISGGTEMIVNANQLANFNVKELVNTYLPYFEGLSNAGVQVVISYIMAWIPLRRCCGVQMSKYHRSWLLSGRHESLAVGPCTGIDVNKAEIKYMSTELYKSYKRTSRISKMAQPALKDGSLNGTYCESYAIKVESKQLKFNEA